MLSISEYFGRIFAHLFSNGELLTLFAPSSLFFFWGGKDALLILTKQQTTCQERMPSHIPPKNEKKKVLLVKSVNCPTALCLCPSDTVPSGLVTHHTHNCNLAFPLLPQGHNGLEQDRPQRPGTMLMIISVQTQWAPWRGGAEHLGNNVPSCVLFG